MIGQHLLGIYEKAMPDSMCWEEKFKCARALGFDFVEISVDETPEKIARLYWPEEEKERFREAVLRSGMRLQSLCLSAHRLYPFGSADSAVREKARDIMARAIAFANEFGIRVIQLAGYDVYYEQSTPDSRRAFREGLAWACEQAGRYQVMLSMEIMDTPLMSSISRYMGFRKELVSPWFTVYPDTGNLSGWKDNDVLRELELGYGEIAAVHVKESIRETEDEPGVFKHVRFGTGCVDFAGIFAKLERLGYSGPYTIEMWCEPGRDPVEEIRTAKQFIEEKFLLGVRR